MISTYQSSLRSPQGWLERKAFLLSNFPLFSLRFFWQDGSRSSAAWAEAGAAFAYGWSSQWPLVSLRRAFCTAARWWAWRGPNGCGSLPFIHSSWGLQQLLEHLRRHRHVTLCFSRLCRCLIFWGQMGLDQVRCFLLWARWSIQWQHFGR